MPEKGRPVMEMSSIGEKALFIIKIRHRTVNADADEAFYHQNSLIDPLVPDLLLVLAPFAQNIIHLFPALKLTTDPEPKPGEVFGLKRIDDIGQTVVATGAAAFFHP